MPRVLVADAIAEQGLERLRAAGVAFDVRTGLGPDELASMIRDYDGMLIRSGVKVTREMLANPGRLAVIARAGVGVDNVDLEAATEAGVLVMNTPDANTLSTAEHAFALMLALHRCVASAHAHVCQGQWSRGSFQGEQLAGKTLGIVGYGRIGRTVARRALAFEMKVVVFDPFVSAESAREESVTVAPDLISLLKAADCVTLHASLSDATEHLIGREQLAVMKPGAKLINCARGALVDEAALAEALEEGRLSGAAIDVFQEEPPRNSPLLTAKNILLTPHLGASTTQAQAQVSIDAVDSMLAYLQRGEIRSAVNVRGLPGSMTPRGRAFMDLCGRMGAMLSPWCAGGVDRISLTARGEAVGELAPTLAWQAMVQVLGPHLESRLTLVNAKEQAQRRGIQVEHIVESPRPNQPESIHLTVHSRGERHDIEGTVYADRRPRVLGFDGYDLETVPERDMALIFNDDRPGVIGLVGQHLGEAGINIADMSLARSGKTALMVLKLDAPLPEAIRKALRDMRPPILSVYTLSLPPVPEASGTS